jgi:hypothetical protein
MMTTAEIQFKIEGASSPDEAALLHEAPPQRVLETCRGFFSSHVFFVLGNAYIWQDTNDLRRKTDEIKAVFHRGQPRPGRQAGSERPIPGKPLQIITDSTKFPENPPGFEQPCHSRDNMILKQTAVFNDNGTSP